jgi:hypothetical protein
MRTASPLNTALASRKTRTGHTGTGGAPGAGQVADAPSLTGITTYVTYSAPVDGAAVVRAVRMQSRAGSFSEPQHSIHLQSLCWPVARRYGAASSWWPPLRWRFLVWLRVRPISRCLPTIFSSAGRGAVCPHAGVACQPGTHSGSQWFDPGVQRAIAQHLGHSGRRGCGQAATATLAKLLEMPVADWLKSSMTRTRPLSGSSVRSMMPLPARSRDEHQGHLPAQGVQARIPRGRVRRACGRVSPMSKTRARKGLN